MAGQVIVAAVIGLLIGGSLGWWIVRRQQSARSLDQAKRQQGEILDSLDVLCRAQLQQQVEASEAVIRISALLDSLPVVVEPKVDLAAIHHLAEQCQQFQRGEQRKSLTPRERHRQDQQRWTLEKQQAVAVDQAVQRLAEVLPSWRAGLSR
ncbi:MAG: DUF2489 domain-containing protein [Alcanivorax sp.]|nr:DUF2489 domain-containing protein [Alcanivorax sp.]